MSNAIPTGWIETPLNRIVFFQEGPGLRKWQFSESGIPFLNIRTFENGSINKSKCQFVKMDEFKGKYEHFLLNEGDIVVSSSGTLGKVATIQSGDLPLMLNTSTIRFRSIDPSILNQDFLRFYLQSQHFFRQIESAKTGSAILNYGPSHLKQMNIVIPPLPEQHRLVAKLEKLLGKVEACKKRLDRIPIILKRFRQSVLAAACSGKLTEDWREENGFIEEWPFYELGEVADLRLGKMLDKAKNKGKSTKYLRNINVRWFGFDLTDLFEMKVTDEEKFNLSIKEGDLLICEGGEPGRCAIWKFGPTDLIFQKALHRVRTTEKVSPDWIALNIFNDANSGKLDNFFTGSTIKHLTGRKLALYTVTVPQPIEQHEIVRRVESLFSLADQIESRYHKAKAYIDKLTQSILAKAFRGELVPQDPNDEPASVLLERIQDKNGRSQKRIESLNGGKRHMKMV